MILKSTICASIVAAAGCLVGRGALAAAFQAGAPSDVNWIRFDTINAGVYNSDTQAAHSVTAPGAIAVTPFDGGSFYDANILGWGNGGTITCTLTAYGLTTHVLSSASATYSGGDRFTLTIQLPRDNLGPNPNGLYSFGVSCSLPPVSARGYFAEVLAVTSGWQEAGSIQAAGWVPMRPADLSWIASTGFSVVNVNSVDPQFITASVSAQQLRAGNHTMTFLGFAGSSSSLCAVNATNLATGAQVSKSVTIASPLGTYWTVDATVNLPVDGMYDASLECKLGPRARIFGARGF